ncbi:MAG: hypothetical protein HY399_00995 [Elusimicrobia bacterium]|nr:hypothetical protein [Elusimicrobiota bacterium]
MTNALSTREKILFSLLLFSSTFLIYRIEIGSSIHLNPYRILLYTFFILYGIPYALNHMKKDLPLMILSVLCCLKIGTLFYSPDFGYGVKQMFRFLESVMVYIVLVSITSKSIQNSRAALNALFWGFAVVILAGLYQQAFLSFYDVKKFLPLTEHMHLGFDEVTMAYPFGMDDRLLSTFQEPNWYGSYLALGLCLLGSAVLFRKLTFFTRMGFCVTALAASINLLCTLSRSSFLALLFGGLTGLVLVFPRILQVRKFPRYAFRLAPMVALPILLVLVSNSIGLDIFGAGTKIIEILKSRNQDVKIEPFTQEPSIENLNTMTGGRFTISLSVFQNLSLKTFLLGVGEGGGETAMHNAIFLTLQENGIIVLFLLLFFLGGIFLQAFGLYRTTLTEPFSELHYIGFGAMCYMSALCVIFFGYGTQIFTNFPWIGLGLISGTSHRLSQLVLAQATLSKNPIRT